MGHSVNAVVICLILSLEALMVGVTLAFHASCCLSPPSLLLRRRRRSSSSTRTTTTLLLSIEHHHHHNETTVTASQKPQSSTAQSTNTCSSRANLTVRRLLQRILERLQDKDDIAVLSSSSSASRLQNWTKTRNYLYRSSHRLSVDQIDRVLNFLQEIFPHDGDLQRWIVQESPRILRKNCETKLRPTVQLLQNLYGNDMLKQAVWRNPDLLLTRGMGFDLDSNSLELNHIFLQQELGLTQTKLEKVKERLPAIFQAPVSKLLSVIHFYRHYLLQSLDDNEDGGVGKANQAIGKLLVAHPQIFLLSVEQGLRPRIEFLQERCQWNDADVGTLIQSSSAGAVLGLSVEDNLKPTLDFLSQRLEPEQLSRTVKAHAQLLGLSLANLQSKVSYFDSIEESCPKSRASRGMLGNRQLTDSLASRMLIRSPTVFSLSLKDNIAPKVQFLAGLWGVQSPVYDSKSDKFVSTAEPEEDSSSPSITLSLAQHLRQYPSVLALSLEGNLRPTIEFYNRTGYVSLDCEWKLHPIKDDDDDDNWHILRGRDMAASLWSRLLPRWHFVATTMEHGGDDDDDDDDDDADIKDPVTQKPLLPLHILVSANDNAFCEAMGLDIETYRIFKTEEIPRLKFSSQFNTWLKTGRPIDIQ